MNIQVTPYDPVWPKIFQRIYGEIRDALSAFNPVIEHIGSTAVTGMAAKPVIDIAVGVNKEKDLDLVIQPMQNLHYIYYKAFDSFMPRRRLFVGLKKDVGESHFPVEFADLNSIPHERINPLRESHVHVWVQNSPDWHRHLAFRDYLRSHPEIVREYSALKLELSKRSWKDGMEYNQAKDAFIKEVEARALEWYMGDQSKSHESI